MPAVWAAARTAGKTRMLVNRNTVPAGLVAELTIELAKTDIRPGKTLVLEPPQPREA